MLCIRDPTQSRNGLILGPHLTIRNLCTARQHNGTGQDRQCCKSPNATHSQTLLLFSQSLRFLFNLSSFLTLPCQLFFFPLLQQPVYEFVGCEVNKIIRNMFLRKTYQTQLFFLLSFFFLLRQLLRFFGLFLFFFDPPLLFSCKFLLHLFFRARGLTLSKRLRALLLRNEWQTHRSQ